MLAEAKVAVIGGGIGGLSVLYHLAKLGWTDAVLLEEAELTSGTTWHAAGLCTQFTRSYNLMGLLKYSLELYRSIAARVYAGEMAVAKRLNDDVTTAFPIAEAIPKLQPGVYVLAAFASTKKEDEGYRQAVKRASDAPEG